MNGTLALLLTLLAALAPGAAPAIAGGKPATPADPGGTGCDGIDPAVCMLPFPNDFFTRADDSSATGRRVNFQLDAMPRNRAGKPIDPRDYNWSDGFSPGSMIVVHVPGLHTVQAFRNSGLPPIDDPASSLEPDSPLIVLDADTGERQPVWAEIDSNPEDPGDVNLIVRPARNFAEGHRIVVGLRNLRDADGNAIQANAAFDRMRDGDDTSPRGRHVEDEVVKRLEDAGVDKDELVVAWDFTVASAESTTGRLLSIRDRAFADLGDRDLADGEVEGRAPRFRLFEDLPDDGPTVNAVLARVGTGNVDGYREWRRCDKPSRSDCPAGTHPWIARQIKGVMTIPCYLDAPGCPNGSRFAISPANPYEPVQIPGNTTTQTFTCNIPHWAVENPGQARAGIYGHGLFGTQGEIDQDQLQYFSEEHGRLFCAADWKGMAAYDVPTAAVILQDLSQFPALVDHTQQGFLGHLHLGRLLRHPEGLRSHPWFRDDKTRDGEPVFDHSHLFYDGNSQGGIYGGALTAVAPDFERAVLGVPGMNYSTLLRRSVDFDKYAHGDFAGDTPVGLYDNYPDELERPLWLSMIQMLWDRADPNGYAAHMTDDPLPNTPAHEVLLHVGFGDHQVADVTTEVEARTIGARVHRPVLEDGRERYRDTPYPRTAESQPEPWKGIADAPDGWPGSAVVVWDIGPWNPDTRWGTPPPPAGNVPPREGRDPHEDPRRTFAAIEQKDAFLRPDGVVKDVCVGPCFARRYRGAGGL